MSIGIMISMGDPANPSNLIDVTAANAIADTKGQYFQKNILYDPKNETKPLIESFSGLLGTKTNPGKLRKDFLNDPNDESKGFNQDKLKTYLITNNNIGIKDELLQNAPNMWSSMNKERVMPAGTTVPDYSDDNFLNKLFDDSFNMWAREEKK